MGARVAPVNQVGPIFLAQLVLCLIFYSHIYQMKKIIPIKYSISILLALLTACAAQTPSPMPVPIQDLTIQVLYPIETTEVEMGQSFKSIIKVLDAGGEVVKDAEVVVSLDNAEDHAVANIPAMFGSGDVYRTDTRSIPHKMQAGSWTLTVRAKSGAHEGVAAVDFHVNDSVSEKLLHQYGFWIDSPSLRGIVPSLSKEQGDALNGAIAWGGVIPSQHIFPESWIEVQWRAGKFDLSTASRLREFMLNTLGNPGVYFTRDIETLEQTKFKNWDAWKLKVRGQLTRYDEQWVIFYAPEVDKTYAIGTTVVLPPTGIDAHETLRKGFEVHPEIHANGTAPKPLPRAFPPVELLSPRLGELFYGTSQPIVLEWKPLKELTEDEYYLVSVDYNYQEANLSRSYTTRETRFVLPEKLYQTPNCGIFNWQVTLMRRTGTEEDGQPKGEPLSFHSLYWYVQWRYPFGEEAPFDPLCPNPQF